MISSTTVLWHLCFLNTQPNTILMPLFISSLFLLPCFLVAVREHAVTEESSSTKITRVHMSVYNQSRPVGDYSIV
ncbi:hypothetical protein XELAEV_18013147mg [Xenopus laevis]|uniref:Uncharacterized protein n=1 Tax=Xenopus laevis TaxID=8355 RepID=A0A974HZD0_XENLA|nr:hypothetical protein XELAEV_18013147mg [Xenopus laevis]